MSRITQQVVERNIRQQRVVEDQRRDLETFSKESAKLLASAGAQSQIESRRRVIQQANCRTEAEYEAKLKEDDKIARLNARMIEQNIALANELNTQASEEERRAREIQRICDEAPELKELEKALQLAYLNKERSVQLQEKIYLAMREQERIQAIEDQMEADRLKSANKDMNKAKMEQERCKEQRAVIQRQIREKQEEREEMERQKLRDRELVDNIVAKINQEDMSEFQKKKATQAAAAKMIRDFEILRQKELEAEKRAQREADEAIENYQKSMASRNEGVEAKKAAKREAADLAFKKIVEESERQRKEEEEFNMLRDMLWEEELEAKRDQEVKERRNKQYQMRKDMMDANTKMLITKEQIRQSELEREKKIISLMRAKFAEDDQKEREQEEAKKLKRLDYKDKVLQQKEERQRLYMKEKEDEATLAAEAARKEEYRKQVIAEARKRLLLQHAAKLQGFLPNGVIANEEELNMVKSVTMGGHK